jgi:hypothetical protein
MLQLAVFVAADTDARLRCNNTEIIEHFCKYAGIRSGHRNIRLEKERTRDSASND